MTRAIGPAPAHIAPTATPPRSATRQTKPSEEAGFAHQLLTLMQPRAATPTVPIPQRPQPASPDSETKAARSDEEPNDDAHVETNEAASPTTHTASAPSGSSAPTAQAPSSSTTHIAASPTDNSAAVDGTITALAGWIAMKGQLDAPDTNLDAGQIGSSETKSARSATFTHAATRSDRSPIVPPVMSRPSRDTRATEPEPARETHAANDSSGSDTQEMESQLRPDAGPEQRDTHTVRCRAPTSRGRDGARALECATGGGCGTQRERS